MLLPTTGSEKTAESTTDCRTKHIVGIATNTTFFGARGGDLLTCRNCALKVIAIVVVFDFTFDGVSMGVFLVIASSPTSRRGRIRSSACLGFTTARCMGSALRRSKACQL